ncbi:hypothetical protein ACFXJ5_12455 [Streptomyces sp. NPDC059373]
MPVHADLVRVLVVADEDGIAEPLSPAVSEAGRQPFRGGDGATALRTARRCPPHAIECPEERR